MKKLILLGLLLIPVLALSQIGSNVQTQFALNTTYANSTSDTSGVIPYVGGYGIVGTRMTVNDSCNIVLIFQKREPPLTAWTAIAAAAGDTLVNTTNAGTTASIILRNATTDRLGVNTSASTGIRIIAKALTANGVTSPTYVVRVEVAK